MVANFAASGHCVDKSGKPHGAHCRTCLTDAAWRKAVGAPDACPHEVTTETIPIQPKPPTQRAAGLWPYFLQHMKDLAQSGDKGLGDILAREVGPIGGEEFRVWHLKTFGKPCKCSSPLKVDFNARYTL